MFRASSSWKVPEKRVESMENFMANEEFKRALVRSREMGLTVTGRKSGREISVPVWFVTEGESVYLLPLTGSSTEWYKNVLKTPRVRLSVGGAQATANVVPITDESRVDEIVEKFRAKYGARDVEAYYPKHDVAVEIPLD